jgi:hypothetical protein
MKNKDNQSDILWKIFLGLILIAIILASFRLGEVVTRERNLVTPKVVGVYTPLLTSLNGDTNIVVVLDANNKYHTQLSKDISNALQQIEQLNQQGGK